MRNLLRFEWEKQQHKGVILVILLALLSLYVFRAVDGNIEIHTPYSEVLTQEMVDAYREMLSGTVNEEFIENWKKAWREYIDEHRLSDEEIKKKMKKYKENYKIKDILYNMDYDYLVLSSEDFNSEEYYILVTNMIPYIELYEGGAEYAYKMAGSESYAPVLQEDMRKCMVQYYDNKEIVVGYHTGFAILHGINNQLPYTLGIVLLFCFYSLFSLERRNHMEAVQLITRYGRGRLVTAKIFYALLGTTFFWLLFQAAGLVGVGLRFGLSGWNCTVFEVLYPSAYAYSCLKMYLMELIVSYGGTLVFTLFVLAMSALLPGVFSMVGGLALVMLTFTTIQTYQNVIPAFSLAEKMRVLTPTELMGAFHTFQGYQGYAIGNFVIRLPQMSFIAIFLEMAVLLLLIMIYRRR